MRPGAEACRNTTNRASPTLAVHLVDEYIPRTGAVAMLHELKAVVRTVVPTSLLARRYERRFLRVRGWRNLHLGLYATFAEAREFLTVHGLSGRYVMDQKAWSEEREQDWHTHDARCSC